MDILPGSNDHYSSKDYCQFLIVHRNLRYSQEANDASFDWLRSYADVADILRILIPDRSSKILMLGCGNSKMSAEMYDDGYHNIVNIDYSSVIIDKMKERYRESRPGMEWHEMDVRQIRFDNDTFDVAIDKSTMDAIMSVKGDIWNPPQQVIDDCTKEVSEVIRILRKGKGLFLCFTFGQPHFRKRYLTVPQTTLELRELGETFHYYLYILRT